MDLSEADKEDITKRLVLALDERRSVPESTHRNHHRFIESWIEKEKRKEELRQHASRQAIGWSVFALLSALGIGAYNWLEAVIKRITG